MQAASSRYGRHPQSFTVTDKVRCGKMLLNQWHEPRNAISRMGGQKSRRAASALLKQPDPPGASPIGTDQFRDLPHYCSKVVKGNIVGRTEYDLPAIGQQRFRLDVKSDLIEHA